MIITDKSIKIVVINQGKLSIKTITYREYLRMLFSKEGYYDNNN